MDPHETTRPIRPDIPRATAPPPRTFGPQGPNVGDLIDAYLQDGIVKLTKSSSIDPQDTGLKPVVNPPYWASEVAVSINLTIPPARPARAEGARLAPWSSRPEVHGRTQGAEPMKLTRLF